MKMEWLVFTHCQIEFAVIDSFQPIVHILERNAISFDISEPLGILNLVTFLIKLRVEYVPKVLARVYSVIGDSPVDIRKYLKTLNIPTGGDKNQAAWRKHKPQNV